MWLRIADQWSRTPLSTTGTHILEPDSLQHRYIVRSQKHLSLQQGYTSDSETPLDTSYDLEPPHYSKDTSYDLEHPNITARIPRYSLDTSLNPEKNFPKFFPRGPLLASKNNHGSSHPCSRKYGVS